MKKTAIMLAVVMTISLFAGCFAKPLEITFDTEEYAYLTAEDTLNITTSATTKLYLSKVACAEETVLDEGGPSLQSAYAKDAEATTSDHFELSLDRMEKFYGMLCDVYVTAYDDSTTEETEAVLRVNFGEAPVVEEEVTEEETCEDGTICVDEEVTEEEVVEDVELEVEIEAESVVIE